MEFGLREWMILIGGLLIIAVIVDGVRRMLAERRHHIHMGMSYADDSDDDDDDDDDYLEELEDNPELPNGGARTRGRKEEVASEPVIGSLDINVTALEEAYAPPAAPVSTAPRERVRMPSLKRRVSAKAGAAPSEAVLEGSGADEQAGELLAPSTPVVDEVEPPAPDLEVGEEPVAVDEPEKSPAPSQPDEVLVINVLARDNNGFNGADLLEVLLACDVRFGDMNIFHRHEGAKGNGALQFSIANLVKPGTFDLANIKTFYTPGITLFMQLPGPEDATAAFDCMAETASCLVRNLQGEMRDEGHSVLTLQGLEHYRQRIQEYERKRLTRANRQA